MMPEAFCVGAKLQAYGPASDAPAVFRYTAMPTTVVLFVAVPTRVQPLGTVIDITFYPPAYAIEAIITSICATPVGFRSEEHTSELQSLAYLVCRLLLEKKN